MKETAMHDITECQLSNRYSIFYTPESMTLTKLSGSVELDIYAMHLAFATQIVLYGDYLLATDGESRLLFIDMRISHVMYVPLEGRVVVQIVFNAIVPQNKATSMAYDTGVRTKMLSAESVCSFQCVLDDGSVWHHEWVDISQVSSGTVNKYNYIRDSDGQITNPEAVLKDSVTVPFTQLFTLVRGLPQVRLLLTRSDNEYQSLTPQTVSFISHTDTLCRVTGYASPYATYEETGMCVFPSEGLLIVPQGECDANAFVLTGGSVRALTEDQEMQLPPQLKALQNVVTFDAVRHETGKYTYIALTADARLFVIFPRPAWFKVFTEGFFASITARPHCGVTDANQVFACAILSYGTSQPSFVLGTDSAKLWKTHPYDSIRIPPLQAIPEPPQESGRLIPSSRRRDTRRYESATIRRVSRVRTQPEEHDRNASRE
jgi:hypothetical protein